MSTKVWIPPAHTRKLKRMSLTFCELKMNTAAAKSLQLCLTLCDPIVSSPPGSPVPGILQARTLEWVAMSFCNAWKWKVKVKLLSHIWLLANPWTAAYQAPPSMGFFRQKYWSGLPLPSPENEDYISVTKVCLYICVFLSNVLTLRGHMDGSLPGSSVNRIFQARILEWVATSCSKGSSCSMGWAQVSCVSCFGRQILYH